MIAAHGREIVALDARIHERLKGHPGYEAIQKVAGVGPVFAAVFIAEIGDIDRFDNPRRLCSWAGLTPGTASPTVTCGAAGSPSKAATYCAGRQSRRSPPATANPASPPSNIASGNAAGAGIGRVAAARHLLTLVFYGMRDGRIRCLAAECGGVRSGTASETTRRTA